MSRNESEPTFRELVEKAETERWSRRGFLRRAVRAAAGLAAAPVVVPLAAPNRPVERPRNAADGRAPMRRASFPREDGTTLPPRTVGLRSLGGDFVFDPPGLLVEPGEEVHWLNIGDFHTVSAFHPANDELLPGEVPLRIPEGAEPFHSGMLGLDAGSHFSRRFDVAGVYDYFCQPHYTFGMVGRLVVGEPRGGPAVREGTGELAEAARRALPAVETITGPGGRAYEWAARLNGVLLLRAGQSDAPAGDPAVAARATASGAEADDALRGLLDRADARSAFLEALGRFADGAGTVSYEELVSLIDATKASLRKALAAAEETS